LIGLFNCWSFYKNVDIIHRKKNEAITISVAKFNNKKQRKIDWKDANSKFYGDKFK